MSEDKGVLMFFVLLVATITSILAYRWVYPPIKPIETYYNYVVFFENGMSDTITVTCANPYLYKSSESSSACIECGIDTYACDVTYFKLIE